MPCLSACLTLIISPISPSHPHSPSRLGVGLLACFTLSPLSVLIIPCFSACLTLIISPISLSHPHSPSCLGVSLFACLTLSPLSLLIIPCFSACLALIISPISLSHPYSPSRLCVGLLACLTLYICLTYSHHLTLSSLQSVFFFVCRFAHLLDNVSLICCQMSCLSAYVTLIIIMTLSSLQSVWFVCRSDRPV